jgi:2',3'-cyclic-nucleotide 2'-phosphodiesterase
MKSENIFRVLAFGDVIGDTGRRALFSVLYKLKNKMLPDLVIVNGENSAHGFGITNPVAKQLFDGGIDVITTGNHVWQKKEIFEFIDQYPGLLRPINYPPKTPGHGTFVYEKNGFKVAVINAIGRIFMDPVDCPFQALDTEIERLKAEGVKIILVDFHAEATSEKQVFGWHFDGRISAVWGTHTHVPTADERILPKKTAYISDIGMCGSTNSVIGMKTADAVRKVIQHLPVRFSPEEGGEMEVQGIVIDIDRETGEAMLISRIKEKI